jgi:hypothetical protein
MKTWSVPVFLLKTRAQLWIDHDRERNARIPKAPASVQ